MLIWINASTLCIYDMKFRNWFLKKLSILLLKISLNNLDFKVRPTVTNFWLSSSALDNSATVWNTAANTILEKTFLLWTSASARSNFNIRLHSSVWNDFSLESKLELLQMKKALPRITKYSNFSKWLQYYITYKRRILDSDRALCSSSLHGTPM